MEKENKKIKSKNGTNNHGLVKEVFMNLSNNITILDLSHKDIADIDENIILPPHLIEMDLSHNNLKNVPKSVLNLNIIERLDLSYNLIELFDETPCFCHSVQELNLSHNKLTGPPYWVWVESPEKLVKIDLSSNINITMSLHDEYLAELLQYKTLVTTVLIFNCRIRDHLELIGTFPAAKTLELGTPDLSAYMNNKISHIPFKGINKCCDIERLNLSNTQLYSVEPNIDMYTNLVEINLSCNNISSIPNHFCNLEKLQVCILSCNNILYLPDDMVKLKELVCLKIDSNELCMLPNNLCMLPHLKILDLYNNSLYEVTNEVMKMEELDLAQNFFEEPGEEEYLRKKEKLRLNILERRDGRKEETTHSETEYSPDTTDDEELLNDIKESANIEPTENRQLSSPEDWDSDEYWTPFYVKPNSRPQQAWIHFIQAKMEEGNFCPIDMHTVSVSEMVKYEKQCNPKKWTFVPGQFDDCSDDDS